MKRRTRLFGVLAACVSLTLWFTAFRAVDVSSVHLTVLEHGASTTPRLQPPPFDPVRPLSVLMSAALPQGKKIHIDHQEMSLPSEEDVILFLAGGRWDAYFVRECLPRLELYFLACYKRVYPVHIFHESLPMAQRSLIASKVPSAKRTDFEDVSAIWKTLPKGVSEDALSTWMNTGLQKKFQGRGYRIMCRFWHGLVWALDSMKMYAYYWRLDTDSILTGPPRVNPFVVMRQRTCDYGFNRLKGENPHVATGMWETYLKWAKRAESDIVERQGDWSPVFPHWLGQVEAFALDGPMKSFWAPMYYNNFELGSMRLKRHPLYASWFEYVDTQEPFGTFRYRWGDAPLHTLGVEAVLAAEGWSKCNFTKADVGYRHAAERPGAILPLNCTASAP